MFDLKQPISPAFDRRLVALTARRSFEAEQFRRLRHRLEDLATQKNVRVVAVTSAAPHDGKTMTSINLAASLAQARQSRVLLIDADLRRPHVATTLRIDDEPGLLQLLARGGADIETYIRRVPGTTLDVLPCERRQTDTYEVLTAPSFQTLLARARATYSTVIVDTPPVVPVPDSSLLGRLVDGYLVVVAANATPRKLLGEALTLLDPASVLGLVFNRDARPLFGYYHAYHDAYFQPHLSGPQEIEA